jgi:hypothetical protein
METNNQSNNGELEKLALICDGVQKLFPNGKQAIVFELNNMDFKKIQSNFREVDSEYKRFQIDMSGVECVFINQNIYNEIKEETPKVEKTGFFIRLKNRFFGNERG